MIQISPTLTETQARVYESYAKWNHYYFSPNKALNEAKLERMNRHLAMVRAFDNKLREEINLPPREYDD